jgi:hypothetical protein
MDSKSKEAESGLKKTIPVDWDSQEWFRVWLQLSRRAGQGRTDNSGSVRTPEPASAS